MPYTKYIGGMGEAFAKATDVSAALLNAGVDVFCPVVHFHPISERMPEKPHKYWMDRCQLFMDLAAGLLIVQMVGWEESDGIREERIAFENSGRRVVYLGWPMAHDTTADDLRKWYSFS